MRTRPACIAIAATIATARGSSVAANQASRYTGLTDKDCVRHVDDAATDAVTLDCPGVGGFRLLVLEDDDRSSITVVTPAARQLPLNYWDVVTRGFSTLRPKAEWRVRQAGGRTVPFGLIVQVDVLEQRTAEQPRQRSLFVVARIGGDMACVTHRIDGRQHGAIDQARKAAAENQAPCLDPR